MTWPTYYPPDYTLPSALGAPLAWRPIIRHDQRTRDPVMTGGPRPIGVAVDVWRDGAHLWRSYTPQPGATCDAWTDAVHGPDGPRNHDSGYWSVPGVHAVADWPVPAAASLRPCMGAMAVADLLYSLVAIATRDTLQTVEDIPAPYTAPPSHQVIRQRLAKAPSGEVVVAFEEQGVSVRALVSLACPVTAESGDGYTPTQTWRVRLQRRPVRAGARDVYLPEVDTLFQAPAGAPSHIVARHAKRAAGVTGWQAARPDPTSMTWHLARAPYTLTIEPVDDSPAAGAY